jgi:hypothetical protein
VRIRAVQLADGFDFGPFPGQFPIKSAYGGTGSHAPTRDFTPTKRSINAGSFIGAYRDLAVPYTSVKGHAIIVSRFVQSLTHRIRLTRLS